MWSEAGHMEILRVCPAVILHRSGSMPHA
jgi:hypothetical protein